MLLFAHCKFYNEAEMSLAATNQRMSYTTVIIVYNL
jgi:hypothetical protein